MTLSCPKCGSSMAQTSRIAFPVGPAKLVYTCANNANHVQVLEESPESA